MNIPWYFYIIQSTRAIFSYTFVDQQNKDYQLIVITQQRSRMHQAGKFDYLLINIKSTSTHICLEILQELGCNVWQIRKDKHIGMVNKSGARKRYFVTTVKIFMTDVSRYGHLHTIKMHTILLQSEDFVYLGTT